MKRKILLLLLVLFSSIPTYSQNYGTIFTKEEANIQFGNVLESVTLSIATVNSIINSTQNVVMFKIINGQLILLGDNRNVIYPVNFSVANSEVFTLYSKGTLQELLNFGDGNQVSFERRGNCCSITFGTHTLERGLPCPPFCE